MSQGLGMRDFSPVIQAKVVKEYLALIADMPVAIDPLVMSAAAVRRIIKRMRGSTDITIRDRDIVWILSAAGVYRGR